jgi:predicted HTH domain antitoxin
MPAITIDVPPDDLAALKQSPEQFAVELRLAAALHWWSQGRLSLGRAARIAGVSHRKFMDEIAARKVIWPYDEQDLAQDLKTLSGE